jgi:peptide/nickel transport system permease protein
MKKFIHYLFLLLTSIAGLLFFMVFPRLFAFQDPDSEHLGINLFSFLKVLGDTVMQFLKPASWQFFESWNTETVIDRYTYSLEVIFVSLLFSIVIGSLIAYLFMIFPYKQRSRLYQSLILS